MTTGRTTRTNGRNSKALTQPNKPPRSRPAKNTNGSGSGHREVRLPLYTETKTAAKPKEPSCTSCGLCCSYVAIEVDTPKTVKQATQLLWYVYHEGVSLYVNDDDWMVQFDTTCIHLQPDYRCGVYETRPHICREFSEQDCEINTGDDGRTFYTASEFLEHLAQTRPRVHAVVKKSFSPPAEGPRTRLTPFEHRFRAVMSRRSALGV
ncbi:MAG TPA: YkgJ family cysteine cluster protein [Polyangiales bacterium]|jgi:Fe-S-cluster containining protein|nr:YkgJ family cysteine cluster protein [Polyangiales bacterium]